MKRSELSEFEFEEEGFKIKIKRGPGGQPVFTSGQQSAHPFPQIVTDRPVAPAPQSIPVAGNMATNGDETGFTYVKSPMVGTFYRSPSPENPAYVEVGAKVEEKTVVCIIEAMKIMNEIQAETKGTVVEVLVESGQPVEYGQRLFKIKLT